MPSTKLDRPQVSLFKFKTFWTRGGLRAPKFWRSAEGMISHNSWTDWAREPVKTSLDAGESKEYIELDKNRSLRLKFLRKIHICEVVLKFWKVSEKTEKHVPRSASSLTDPVFALCRPPKSSKTGFFQKKSIRVVSGGKLLGSKSVS